MGKFEVKVLPDIEFAQANGKPLLLDLYLPMGQEQPLPVIIWLHGGGWRIGDRKLGPDLRAKFAEKGFAMVSIEYRLSGEAIFPAQIHDVKTAIRWLRAHANEYGLDRGRIGLWGSSAGGHLAALAGTTSSGILENLEYGWPEFSSDVQAVVDGYGPIDFFQLDDDTGNQENNQADPETSRLNISQSHYDPDSPESQLLGAPVESVPELVRMANPITYVKPGAPPFLIMHGLNDTAVIPRQSELLFNALITQGNVATLCLIEGLGHAFFNKNDLDQVPHHTSIRTFKSSENKYEKIKIFELIEAFFHQHLVEG